MTPEQVIDAIKLLNDVELQRVLGEVRRDCGLRGMLDCDDGLDEWDDDDLDDFEDL